MFKALYLMAYAVCSATVTTTLRLVKIASNAFYSYFCLFVCLCVCVLFKWGKRMDDIIT